MAKVYLGSCSALGTVVLSVDDDGRMRVLGAYTPDLEPSKPLLWWGRSGPGARNLARIIVADATGCIYGEHVDAIGPLITRLEKLQTPVWVGTSAEMLAGITLVV